MNFEMKTRKNVLPDKISEPHKNKLFKIKSCKAQNSDELISDVDSYASYALLQ